MNEDGIQIEFTEEELTGEAPTDTGDGIETKPDDSVQDSVVNEQEKSNDAKDENKDEEKPADKTPDTNETNVDTVGKTDEELSVLYGVDVSEIKYAKNMGWTPKEKFRGNPADWKEPKEFIDIAEQSAPVLRDRLRQMSAQVTELKKAFPTILEMQKRELQNKVDSLNSANEQLQKELDEAHLLADSKRAVDIAQKMMDNKLQIAMTTAEQQHLGEKDGLKEAATKAATPDYIDVERERAWRDSVYPKLSLEQREIYDEAVRFVTSPQNADQSTDERIKYIERKVFGIQPRPAAAPVARPTVSATTQDSAAPKNEYAGWDALSSEEKKIAISIIEETEWYQKRETDPKAKAQWNEYKKQF